MLMAYLDTRIAGSQNGFYVVVGLQTPKKELVGKFLQTLFQVGMVLKKV